MTPGVPGSFRVFAIQVKAPETHMSAPDVRFTIFGFTGKLRSMQYVQGCHVYAACTHEAFVEDHGDTCTMVDVWPEGLASLHCNARP